MYSVLVLLGTLLAVSADGHYGVIPPHRYTGLGYAIDETPKPYQFAYQAEAIGGASTRQETADGSGAVAGSYSLSDEDGRKRVVEYVADGAGFRASVKTNEPGTKSESPADVPTVSEAADAPVSHVAPAAYSAAYHSPSHYGAYGSLGYRGYPYGAYSGALGHGRHYGGAYSGALGHGRYYGGAYSGALGHSYTPYYGRGYGNYYGRGLGYGGGYYGGALGYGRHYYGGALGAHGLHGYGSYGGYRGYGYKGHYPYGYGYGLGYRYGRH